MKYKKCHRNPYKLGDWIVNLEVNYIYPISEIVPDGADVFQLWHDETYNLQTGRIIGGRRKYAYSDDPALRFATEEEIARCR